MVETQTCGRSWSDSSIGNPDVEPLSAGITIGDRFDQLAVSGFRKPSSSSHGMQPTAFVIVNAAAERYRHQL
jgi:hypothetical protein